jgi:uncharacterized membrane protein YfcA
VHLLNNVFKVALLGRYARGAVVLRFGVPAAVFSFFGAWVLTRLSHSAPLATYRIGDTPHAVTPLSLVLGGLIALFAAIELTPSFERVQFSARYLPLGGILSGFFGGLSGHQGALRAAFLSKSGLDRDAFLGTSVVCAVMVDCVRLAVYGASFYGRHFSTLFGQDGYSLLAVATLAAFAGSFVGPRLVRKITLRGLQRVIGCMLLVFAVAIGSGLV